MNISRAVITAAGRSQRTLPLQTLTGRDGVQKSVLRILVEEALDAGAEQVCVVVSPGDEPAYRAAAGERDGRLHFVTQNEAHGYGHSLYSARDFVNGEPFLHLVGDHIFVSHVPRGCAGQVMDSARTNSCSVSGVQPTREHLLGLFGSVGGQRVKGSRDLYEIERVMEKPTPTAAEQALVVPGLRAGHYLCFFGIHVLTPAIFDLLARRIAKDGGSDLSSALAELAEQERYLALETRGRRYPLDARYGLLTAQLALALSGVDRDVVLTEICELLAQRELSVQEGAHADGA